jgi:hypothetical protein
MRDEANLARAAGPMTALSAEDRMLAATLQHAVYELRATTGTAMVPLEDGRALANIIVVGDPLSVFTVADRHPVDDDRYTGAVAYRTGRQCVRVRSETPSGVRPAMPFPYAMVATPLADDEGGPSGSSCWCGPTLSAGRPSRPGCGTAARASWPSSPVPCSGGAACPLDGTFLAYRDSSWLPPQERTLCSSR